MAKAREKLTELQHATRTSRAVDKRRTKGGLHTSIPSHNVMFLSLIDESRILHVITGFRLVGNKVNNVFGAQVGVDKPNRLADCKIKDVLWLKSCSIADVHDQGLRETRVLSQWVSPDQGDRWQSQQTVDENLTGQQDLARRADLLDEHDEKWTGR